MFIGENARRTLVVCCAIDTEHGTRGRKVIKMMGFDGLSGLIEDYPNNSINFLSYKRTSLLPSLIIFSSLIDY